MHLSSERQARIVALLCVFQLALATSAHAAERIATVGSAEWTPRASQVAAPFRGQAFGLVNSQVLVALQAVTGQNQCVSYTYDLNGNITAKSNLSFGATATWGSSTFGCFSWTAP